MTKANVLTSIPLLLFLLHILSFAFLISVIYGAKKICLTVNEPIAGLFDGLIIYRYLFTGSKYFTMSAATTECSASHPPEFSVPLLKNKDLPATSKHWKNVELPVDFLVLAVKDWEFRAFLSQLNDNFYKSYEKTLGPVYFGNIRGDIKKQKVAVMKCNMGPDVQGPAIVVPKAVKKLGPKAVFNVGACAGLKKVKQGDVVLSAKVRTYAYTKDTEDGLEERGLGVSLNTLLAGVAGDAGRGWEAPTKLDVEVHHDGVVLSGPRVVNNLEEKEKLMKRFPDATSLEMEAEGKGFTID